MFMHSLMGINRGSWMEHENRIIISLQFQEQLYCFSSPGSLALDLSKKSTVASSFAHLSIVMSLHVRNIILCACVSRKQPNEDE